MTAEELLHKAQALRAEINKLGQEAYHLEQQAYNMVSLLKIGDVITWGKAKRKGRILSIKPFLSTELKDFDYFVQNIKKDGTEGDKSTAYHWEKPTLAEKYSYQLNLNDTKQ